MKRWTRPILAILLGVLALGYVGIIPAQAANRDTKTETVVIYRGYTLSWSEPDASDLRVVRTPGRADSVPDVAIKRSIQQAKSRVANAAQQLSAAATDSCNFVPDSFLTADFTLACDHHDDCYERRSSMSRLNCDQMFLTELINTCAMAPGFQPAQRLTCYAIAGIYFIGVRLFGASFYQGSGSPA
jgi:phospholipase A2-like protein